VAEYIGVTVETDPDTLLEEAFDYIQARYPDWSPNEGNLEVILLGAMAQMASEIRDVASSVPVEVFKFYGESVVGLEPVAAAPAEVLSTWVVKDSAGYTIPEGTLVGVPSAAGEVLAFEVVTAVVIPAGSTATGPAAVSLRALEPGADSSGLGGAGVAAELLDALEYVTSVTLSAQTSGGVDEEEEDLYLNRLSNRLQLMAPRPILARDFAIMAQDVAGVDRATAVDNFIPPSTFNAERAVAVAAVDANGSAIGAATKAEVDAYLQSHREVNFIVNVIDPTYTTIDVITTVKVVAEFEVAAVNDAVLAAVQDYLSPGKWGLAPFGDARVWRNVTVVRYLELSQIINEVDGVDYIVGLTLRKGANAHGTADVSLDGVAALPLAGAVAVTVNP
jgi:uncharacterized phage protein gp47/JayE